MDQNPKQQAVEKLKGASTVLITTSKSPSVDQLTAALGLGQMLKKLGKSVSTIITATIPKQISFLEADKQFEDNLDSLRDFIISLDKKLADKLRYKVEGSEVRIFITPYHARISQDDVRFGQGDFNVDAVVAVGVNTQQDIDEVIQKNSRVLSEAPVISVSVGSNPSAIGTIKWHDAQASGFSEVMVSTSEALQGNLLDESISNTLLTGIIAATNHFTNSDTSPKVMTMAAQLMAAGADQQKIMQELKTEQSKNIIESAPQFNTQQPMTSDDGTDVTPVAESGQQNTGASTQKDATNMAIEHDEPNGAIATNAPSQPASPVVNQAPVASLIIETNPVATQPASLADTSNLDNAKAAVEAAMSNQPVGTAFNPVQDLGAKPLTSDSPAISPNNDSPQFQFQDSNSSGSQGSPAVTPVMNSAPGQVNPSSLYPQA